MSRFRDRITGRVRADLPGTLVFGQMEIVRADGVRVNGCPAAAGHVICGDRQGRWTVDVASGERWTGVVGQAAVPAPEVLANLRAPDLAAAATRSRPLDEWLACPPLALEMLQREHALTLREQQLADDRGALAHVCQRPRTLLRRDTERTLTGRARRIAPKAEEFLASHPEDWERRRMGTVVPRCVLASVVDEEWNTYENRVAARLVDRCRVVLQARVRELTKALDMLRELANLADFDDGISHRKWDRICRLLGHAGDPRNGFRAVERVRDTVAGLLLAMRGLEDSPLYTHVPRRAVVVGALRPTNVLAHDQFYSKVARLWRLFGTQEVVQGPSELDVYLERQRIAAEYEQFAALVIMWALADLGFRTPDGSVPTQDDRIEVKDGRGLRLSLEWSAAGFVLRDAEGGAVQLLPLPHALTAEGAGAPLEIAFSALLDAAGQRCSAEPPLVVLFPSTVGERRLLPPTLQEELRRQAERSLSSPDKNVRLVGVSPLEVDSVERVARVIRWWLLERAYLSFPPVMPCAADPTALVAAHPSLLLGEGRRTVRLLRRPSSSEDVALRSPGATESPTRRAGNRAARADTALPTLVEAEALDQAVALLDRICRCPVCDRAAEEGRDLRSSSDGFFRGTCRDCGTVWGAQPCGACHTRYALVLPGGRATRQASLGPEWAELQYGRDLLASPCWSPEGGAIAFICPACRRCPNDNRPGTSGCDRCTAGCGAPGGS